MIVLVFLCDSLGFVLLAWTWVLSLCSFFSPLLGVLFNGVCQGFVILECFKVLQHKQCH
jgi:hypothetical protein